MTALLFVNIPYRSPRYYLHSFYRSVLMDCNKRLLLISKYQPNHGLNFHRSKRGISKHSSFDSLTLIVRDKRAPYPL